MSNKLFYRLELETSTGMSLLNLYKKGIECINKASKLAKELGASEFNMAPSSFMGGIGSLYFDRKPSERGYEIIDRCGSLYVCVPNTKKTKGIKIASRFMELPTVSMKEYIDILGIDEEMEFLPDMFLLEGKAFFFCCQYSIPTEDMTQITNEEYSCALAMMEEQHRKA